jgi:hypothetical protein
MRSIVNPSVNTANNRLNGYTFDTAGITICTCFDCGSRLRDSTDGKSSESLYRDFAEPCNAGDHDHLQQSICAKVGGYREEGTDFFRRD